MAHSARCTPGGRGKRESALALARSLIFLLWTFSLLVLASCAANPATGKRQLNLYSEAQEIALGREADREISAQLGTVDDPALQEWVGAIGRRLAAASERPGLPWSFKVVDDPVVNAFALPGGFIYVTRGILAHLGSEAQLAGVLGHEIGHVTAQHSVNQMSKQQLAAGGLLVGMAVAPEVARLGDLAQTGLGLLFLKYGRDDERQSDELGLRYMVRTGYETRELPDVFDVLRRVGEVAGAGRIPNWLSSHPDPEYRRENAERLIAAASYPPGEVAAERFLRRIDGLVFGADPRDGYFEGTRFYHPGMAFTADLPAGWAAANETTRVIAQHPEKIAQIELTLAPGSDPDAAAREFLGQEGVQAASSRRTTLNGLSAVEAEFEVPRQDATKIVGRVAFVAHGGRVFRLMAVALEEGVAKAGGDLRKFVRSFARLTDGARLSVEPQRVALVELPAAMSFEEFLRRYPSDGRPEVLALINAVSDTAARLPSGRLMKRLAGRQVGSQRIEPESR